MFIELAHNNHYEDRNSLLDKYNITMNSNISLLSIFPFHASYFTDFSKISLMIDYPYGLGSADARKAEVHFACELGVKAIDITLNHHLLGEEQYGQIINELVPYSEMCKNYNVIPRVLIEYKFIEEKYIKNLALLLKNANIKYLITSTMNYVDDYVDNLIISERIHSCGVNTICASSMWLDRHIALFPKTKNYAIKTNSINFVKKYINLVYNNIGTDNKVLEASV